MRLTGTLPAAVTRLCAPFDASGAACDGLPPISCSAFGDHSRLSTSSLAACVTCPASAAATTAKVALAAVLVPLAAVAYVVAVDRFPHYREWIATASLVLSHVQVVGLLGSLAALSHADVRLGWLKDALRTLLVFSADVTAVDPQCLLPPQPPLQATTTTIDDSTTNGVPVFTLDAFIVSPGFLGTLSILVLPALAFLVIRLAQLAAMRRVAAQPPLEVVNVGAAADAEAPPALPPAPHARPVAATTTRSPHARTARPRRTPRRPTPRHRPNRTPAPPRSDASTSSRMRSSSSSRCSCRRALGRP